MEKISPDIIGKTPQEIHKAYRESSLIKDLLKRDFDGKCGKCELKRICGGCRATAYGMTGSYKASDTTCWR